MLELIAMSYAIAVSMYLGHLLSEYRESYRIAYARIETLNVLERLATAFDA